MNRAGPAGVLAREARRSRGAFRATGAAAGRCALVRRSRSLLLVLALAPTACQPDLSPRPHTADPKAAAPDPPPPLAFELVPPADGTGHTAGVLQIVVTGSSVDPETVALVSGDVSDVALRGLRDGKPPASTASRIMPTTRFAPGDDTLVVAPRTVLSPGKYTLAVGSRAERRAFVVGGTDGVPLLARAFPPEGAAVATSVRVFCGAAPLAEALTVVGHVPGDAPTPRRGLFDDATETGCVTLATAQGVVPPALAAGGAIAARLDPTPAKEGPATALTALTCAAAEVPIGLACAAVEDDRLVVRAPPGTVLASVRAGTAHARVAPSSAPFVVKGLPPSSTVHVSILLADGAARVTRAEADVTTGAPRGRLVLSESLADPLGAEPLAEWVEIVNDGTLPVALEAFRFRDQDTSFPLPPMLLAPGAYALLVNEGFQGGGPDVAPAPGTTLIALPHLGKNGLSNEGEELALLDETGAIVSRLPPAPRPKAGSSLSRVAPEALDADPSSFAVTRPTPGARNAD